MLNYLAAALILVHSWYPTWCCGSQDCHPVPCSEITIAEGTAVLPSPDQSCHACVHLGSGGYQHLYCVFVPPAIS